MARLLLVLLAGVTALLLVGAEDTPPGTLLVGAGGPWPGSLGGQHHPDTKDGLQLSKEDITGERLPLGEVRCTVCKVVVEALTGIVVDLKDKGAVDHVINRVCGKLKKGAHLCRVLLDKSLEFILKALRRQEAPTRICTHLRWCHQSP